MMSVRADLLVLSKALLLLHDSISEPHLSSRLLGALRILLAPDEMRLEWATDSRLQRLLGDAGTAAGSESAQHVSWSQRPRASHRLVDAARICGQDARHLSSRVELAGGAWLQMHVFRYEDGFDRRSKLQLELLSAHILAILARALGAPAQRRRNDAQNQRRAFQSLSQREQDVLEGLMQQKQNREIAETLGISAGTVKRHLENIYAKLGVSGRTEARLLYGNLYSPNRR